MRRLRIAAIGLCALLSLAALACGQSPTADRAAGGAPFPVNFDPADFGRDSANVDNRWLPMEVGTRSVLEGGAYDGEDRISRRVVSIVTDQVKQIAGVRSRVEWDRDYNDGVLHESELAFSAQDKAGNVWHMGEYVESYDEEGALDGSQAWLVGYLRGAKAGIEVQGNPRPGATYAEGFAPAPLYWDDHARVRTVRGRTCVPVACYRDVLVIQEFEPRVPGAFQLKYYAPGAGNVRVGWGGPKEDEKETLTLTGLDRLATAQLAAVRAEAMKLEARAYVYGPTPRMNTSS